MSQRRPLLWTVLAFITVMITAIILSIWWNVLLVQNHRILESMTAAATAAAKNPDQFTAPLALLMVIGILCFVVLLLGLVYMFIKLINTVQLNIAQSQFISAVTHELRSPVTSIQLLFESLQDPQLPLEKKQIFETAIQDDLERLKQTVERVLNTSRLENYQVKPTLEPLSVYDILSQLIHNYSNQFLARSQTAQLYCTNKNCLIRANHFLFQTALSNIIENAIKYSPDHSDIQIHVSEVKNHILIQIKDKGIGLAQKESKKIFKRFYRVGNTLTQSRQGTGLGLYFAKIALAAQKSKIYVHSDGLGQGTTFSIEVPRA